MFTFFRRYYRCGRVFSPNFFLNGVTGAVGLRITFGETNITLKRDQENHYPFMIKTENILTEVTKIGVIPICFLFLFFFRETGALGFREFFGSY